MRVIQTLSFCCLVVQFGLTLQIPLHKRPISKKLRMGVDTEGWQDDQVFEDQFASNYLYLIDASIGTPPQTTQLLIGINSPYTYIFQEGLVSAFDSQKMNPNGFYAPGESSTNQNISLTMLKNLTSNGFIMNGFEDQDLICFLADDCITTDFINVISISFNNWFIGFNLTQVGGIFGLGPSTNLSMNPFWMSNLAPSQQFSVDIMANSWDWNWIPNAPDVDGSSYLYIGGIDPIISEIKFDFENIAVILTSSSLSEWSFDTQSFSFGDNSQEAYQADLTTGYTTLDVGFNGVGLPKAEFAKFNYLLDDQLQSQGLYLSNGTSFTYVNGTSCSVVLSLIQDYAFNLTLTQETDIIFQMPISAFMRNNDSSCIFLVVETVQTSNIVLGDVFFQQFYAQFSYQMLYMEMNEISNPMVMITQKKKKLEGSKIIYSQINTKLQNVLYVLAYIVYVTLVVIVICIWIYMWWQDREQDKRAQKNTEEYEKQQSLRLKSQ